MEAKGDKGEEVKDPAERTRKKGIKYQKYEAKETQEAVDKKWVKLRGMTQVKEVPDRSQAEATVEVQKFLTKLQLREADHGEFGTTWLELFTLYKALGHPCPVKDPLKKAQGKPSLGGAAELLQTRHKEAREAEALHARPETLQSVPKEGVRTEKAWRQQSC